MVDALKILVNTANGDRSSDSNDANVKGNDEQGDRGSHVLALPEHLFQIRSDSSDFILLCEFECLKEQRGPSLLSFTNLHGCMDASTFMPLQTEAFEEALNAFILRIMTQDNYNANQPMGETSAFICMYVVMS
jgi:hypothetical protein